MGVHRRKSGQSYHRPPVNSSEFHVFKAQNHDNLVPRARARLRSAPDKTTFETGKVNRLRSLDIANKAFGLPVAGAQGLLVSEPTIFLVCARGEWSKNNKASKK